MSARWGVRIFGPDDLLFADAPITLAEAVRYAHEHNAAVLHWYEVADDLTPLCWAAPWPLSDHTEVTVAARIRQALAVDAPTIDGRADA